MVQNQFALTTFNWMVYGFSFGHFINSSNFKILPFDISFCADPNPAGRELFSQLGAKYMYTSLHELHRAIDSDDSVDAIFLTSPLISNPEHWNQFVSKNV